MRVWTIGFTHKSAEEFFGLLASSGVKRIVDVRLNNVSQLSGFAKKPDLAYFARAIADIDYVHLPELAPTKEILDEYRKGGGDWGRYESRFRKLIADRGIEHAVPKTLIDGSCLLCSELSPNRCHRRLVVEYLDAAWPDMEVAHL